MARPKKIGLDYFPLDVVFNEQIQALESVHGNDGLVWIIKFYQAAYRTEFGEVNLSGLFGSISANNSRTTPEQQKNIIADCIQLGLIYRVSDDVYSSNGVKSRIGKVSSDRKNALERRKNELFAEKPPNNPQTMGESKVKESKVKEIFKKPTQTEISEYAKETRLSLDAERFVDFYESKGWMVGKNKMKDWKAAVRNWTRNQQNNHNNSAAQTVPKSRILNDFASN